MTRWLLFYEYVDDILDRRGPHREAHLARLRSDEALVMAGAVGDPVHGAVIVFGDRDAAERFVRDDPYANAGLVTDWRVEPWHVV